MPTPVADSVNLYLSNETTSLAWAVTDQIWNVIQNEIHTAALFIDILFSYLLLPSLTKNLKVVCSSENKQFMICCISSISGQKHTVIQQQSKQCKTLKGPLDTFPLCRSMRWMGIDLF